MIPQFFDAPDGTPLAFYELGEGRPLLLIHGYISDALTNWMKFTPTAQVIADAGYRVIMPDLRAHGASGKPHDPLCYPPDILADDQFALIAHLGLEDFDAAGYSLGARTTVRDFADPELQALASAADVLVSTIPADAAAGYASTFASAPVLLDAIYEPWPTPLARAVTAAGGEATLLTSIRVVIARKIPS